LGAAFEADGGGAGAPVGSHRTEGDCRPVPYSSRDEIDWVAAGDVIRVIPEGRQASVHDPESRVRLFDQATERHKKGTASPKPKPAQSRGWTREDLYGRGRSR
jgi:hypothetical protein